MTHQSTHTPPRERHDFRTPPHERKDEALEFFRVECPDAIISSFPVDKAAEYHCLVIEECDRSAEFIDGLAESLKGIVHSVSGVDHYDQGAEIYFHAQPREPSSPHTAPTNLPS